MYKWWVIGLLAGIFLFRGKTPIGKPMRTEPNGGVPPGESWFIESSLDDGTPVYSCSFVEFDGRGDYVEFAQHEHAWHTVRFLAHRQPLILVMYCHGWKNNSQSSDVVKFIDFLGRLAATSSATCSYARGYRRYQRTHRIITSPGNWRPLNGLDGVIGMDFYPTRLQTSQWNRFVSVRRDRSILIGVGLSMLPTVAYRSGVADSLADRAARRTTGP
jgi:hypothetical protein